MELEPKQESNEVRLLSLDGLRRAVSSRRASKREGWRKDRLSFYPLNDRGGPVALEPSSDAALGTLATIELNKINGRPLDEGLYPGQLNDPNSP